MRSTPTFTPWIGKLAQVYHLPFVFFFELDAYERLSRSDKHQARDPYMPDARIEAKSGDAMRARLRTPAISNDSAAGSDFVFRPTLASQCGVVYERLNDAETDLNSRRAATLAWMWLCTATLGITYRTSPKVDPPVQSPVSQHPPSYHTMQEMARQTLPPKHERHLCTLHWQHAPSKRRS